MHIHALYMSRLVRSESAREAGDIVNHNIRTCAYIGCMHMYNASICTHMYISIKKFARDAGGYRLTELAACQPWPVPTPAI